MPNEEIMTEQVATSPQPTEEQVVNQAPTPEKTYTHDQVTGYIIQKGQRVKNAICKQYGVKDMNELTERWNSYKGMNEEFGKLQTENVTLRQELAFLRNNINAEKYDDIKAYFKGKEMELTEDNLIKELAKHPEWLKKTMPTITAVGREKSGEERANERAEAEELFHVKF